MPGTIPGSTVLDISRIPGALDFSTHVSSNLTNPAILPDLPWRDQEYIRDLIFDEILGSYTCMVENVYGSDMATTVISECSEYYLNILSSESKKRVHPYKLIV